MNPKHYTLNPEPRAPLTPRHIPRKWKPHTSCRIRPSVFSGSLCGECIVRRLLGPLWPASPQPPLSDRLGAAAGSCTTPRHFSRSLKPGCSVIVLLPTGSGILLDFKSVTKKPKLARPPGHTHCEELLELGVHLRTSAPMSTEQHERARSHWGIARDNGGRKWTESVKTQERTRPNSAALCTAWPQLRSLAKAWCTPLCHRKHAEPQPGLLGLRTRERASASRRGSTQPITNASPKREPCAQQVGVKRS